MARDKITVDLILATKQADREVARINKSIEKLGKSMGRSFGGASGGGDKIRALGSGLSKATVKADEFSKSMEASNARVIAFGASAGLIMAVDRALRAMVSSAMKVEKAMMDVNVVMGVSSRQLEQFGKGMFRVAKETAQSFDTVAEAATELARQGLGMEKTLARAKDALILTRLTGMKAADAVRSLTAAINSFNKEGVTSAQIVNRMAKVDAAFAVSSEDLAKSISRVGASAVSAGVNLNELMAITTAVQQRTARGGAVIGNAFKTIFTRIQRTSVQKKLKDFGIASRDMQGNMLGGIQVLQNMADGFDKLTKSQQSSLAESVAGVFQVNILKSALSDLSSQTSNYAGALRTANEATNEAYTRNEQLNQTLDALANKTLANLTKAGAALGGAALEPAIRKILNSVNAVIDAFSEGGQFEDFGKTMGKGLLAGIGNFIAGPGLLIATAAFAKISISLAKFAGTAFKDIMGLNSATKQRVALEEAVVAHIASEPALLAQVRAGTLNVLAVEQDILATIRLANAERARIQVYAAPLTGALMGRGVRTGSRGATMAPPGGARGFIPNFASPGGERAAAAAGGYRAGSIKTIQQPGAGTMMYNSAETVKRFPGMSQSAIMPPQESPAGAGYKAAFGGAHGFDPYAGGGGARGFVPNFVTQPGRPSTGPYGTGTRGRGAKAKSTGSMSTAQQEIWKDQVGGFNYILPAADIGVLLGFDKQKRSQMNLPAGKRGTPAGTLTGLQQYQPLGKQLIAEGAGISLGNVQFRGYMNREVEEVAEADFAKQINSAMGKSLEDLSYRMMGKLGIEGQPTASRGLNKSAQGHIFEEAMRMAMGAAASVEGAAFDFEANSPPSPSMMKIFGVPGIRRIEAKRTRARATAPGEMTKKYFNDTLMGGRGVKAIMTQREALYEGIFGQDARWGKETKKAGQQKGHLKQMVTSFTKTPKGRPGAAGGFVPNFFMGRLLGRRQAVTHGSALLSPVAKRLQMLPGVGKIKPSVWGDMWKSDNVKKVRDILSGRVVTAKLLGDPRAQALIGSHKGKAMGEAAQSLYEGTLLGLPLSVWVAQQAARRGLGVLTGSVKMIRNVAKKQPIAKGINVDEMFKAGGFVPNFSPLTSAIGREMQAGVPASAIRVGSSPALRGAGNPGGVGVFNTIHEPGGLGQGISRSKTQGVDPRGHGGAGGFVPNYADTATVAKLKAVALQEAQLAEYIKGRGVAGGPTGRTALGMAEAGRELNKAGSGLEGAADDLGKSADKQGKASNALMMAAIGISMAGPSIGRVMSGGTPSGEAKGAGFSNMLSMGAMGAASGAMMASATGPGAFVTGAIGGAAGLTLGALGMDWDMAFGEGGEKANAERIKSEADAIAEGLKKVEDSLASLADLDFMSMGSRFGAYEKFQKELIDLQTMILEGGGEMGKASELFFGDKDIQKLLSGQFKDFKPDQFGGVKDKIKEVRTAAMATITGGSPSAFKASMERVALKEQRLRVNEERLRLGGGQGGWGSEEFMKDLRTSRKEVANQSLGAFPAELQETMVTARVRGKGTRSGGKVGQRILQNYATKMDSGDVRGALRTIIPLLRETKQTNMADALEKLANNEDIQDNKILIKGTLMTPLQAAARGEVLPGGTMNPAEIYEKAGFSAMRLIESARQRGTLGMFRPGMYGPEEEKKLTREQQDKLNLQKAGIGRLQPMIDTARQEGREAGYDIVRGKGVRRRELAGGAAERANEKRLNAVTMFGEGLIEATRAVELTKIEQQHGLKVREAEDARRTKIAGDLAKAEEKYLTAIRDAKIGEEQRTKAEKRFDVLAGMSRGDQITERNRLQKDEFRSTTEGIQLDALNTLIKETEDARGKEKISIEEAGKDLTKFTDILDENVVAQKKLLDETKKFKPGKFLDAIETEKSILMGRIELEKQMVEEGRLIPAVLRKSRNKLDDLNNKLGETHDAVEDHYRKPLIEQAAMLVDVIRQQEIEVRARRLNITALEASKMSLEELKQKIDGTGDALGELVSQMRRSMEGLTPLEKEEAQKEAVRDFSALIKSRQADPYGAQALLDTGDPKRAFEKGLISGDEYRQTRRAARLGRGGDPMEAFRDQFKYGGRDVMLEMEDGVTNVARTMKSSFADAFQSIASGANTVQGALANMAQSILNSISSISANMMTNMLFSKWQGANGGLVPGYQGGGVVRGGSGYKDDVPTMMQGGEFVIKKSSAQKIGYGNLNAINGYQEGGPTKREGPGMGTMAMVSMGASALSGVIGAATQPGSPKPLPSRDYGFGKGKYGHFGGADPDAGQVDTVTGGGGRAGVSLSKGFVYYRRDPETGRLISERARPTEGRFEVSRGLSLMGRLGEDDPQTGRMFGKEQTMAKYQDYLETETQSRKDQIDAVKRQKKQRLIGAYMNAAMMIGGAKWMQGQQQAADLAKQTGGIGSTNPADWGYAKGYNLSSLETTSSVSKLGGSLKSPGWGSWVPQKGYSPYMGGGDSSDYDPGDALGGYKHYANGGRASGTPAMVMGGEYIMSPETVRTYGSNFMHELNRGNAPSYANGGPVGGISSGNQGPHSETLIGGNTTNNVKISVNIDKAGKADAKADSGSGDGDERENNAQANQSKEFGKLLQGVVLEEIVKQQRPGGLLRKSPHAP